MNGNMTYLCFSSHTSNNRVEILIIYIYFYVCTSPDIYSKNVILPELTEEMRN